jgi:hypothetical protein
MGRFCLAFLARIFLTLCYVHLEAPAERTVVREKARSRHQRLQAYLKVLLDGIVAAASRIPVAAWKRDLCQTRAWSRCTHCAPDPMKRKIVNCCQFPKPDNCIRS